MFTTPIYLRYCFLLAFEFCHTSIKGKPVDGGRLARVQIPLRQPALFFIRTSVVWAVEVRRIL